MIALTILAGIFGLMLAESALSRAHERRLRELGAREPADDVYLVMRMAYPVAFLLPALEGWWRYDGQSPFFTLGLGVLGAAKALKYWVMYTLRERWTFKVLVPPGSRRIERGPYRFVAHPNYIAVAGEILGAGLLLGGIWSGIIFTIAFGWLMLRRIQVEERALS